MGPLGLRGSPVMGGIGTAVMAALAERWNAGDLDGVIAMLDDEVVLVTDPLWPDGGEYRGRTAVRRFYADFVEAYESRLTFDAGAIDETPGLALVPSRLHAHGRASGMDAAFDHTMLVRHLDGRITGLQYFSDAAAARAAAGI